MGKHTYAGFEQQDRQRMGQQERDGLCQLYGECHLGKGYPITPFQSHQRLRFPVAHMCSQVNRIFLQRVDQRSAYTGALEEEEDRVLQSLEQENTPARYVARWVAPRAELGVVRCPNISIHIRALLCHALPCRCAPSVHSLLVEPASYARSAGRLKKNIRQAADTAVIQSAELVSRAGTQTLQVWQVVWKFLLTDCLLFLDISFQGLP